MKNQLKIPMEELAALDRLSVFDDSQEVAMGVWNEANTYWNKEAATHIDGLWEAANVLADIVRKYHDTH